MLCCILAINAPAIAHTMILSAEEFFTEFAYPASESFGTCPGLSFMTPNGPFDVTLSVLFKNGPPRSSAPYTCTGTEVGSTLNLETSCPSPNYRSNTLYCINLDKVSTLAIAGATAQCVVITNGGGVSQNSGVTCSGVGNCSYATTFGPSFTLTGAAC